MLRLYFLMCGVTNALFHWSNVRPHFAQVIFITFVGCLIERAYRWTRSAQRAIVDAIGVTLKSGLEACCHNFDRARIGCFPGFSSLTTCSRFCTLDRTTV